MTEQAINLKLNIDFPVEIRNYAEALTSRTEFQIKMLAHEMLCSKERQDFIKEAIDETKDIYLQVLQKWNLPESESCEPPPSPEDVFRRFEVGIPVPITPQEF